jgi:hypothetical protein
MANAVAFVDDATPPNAPVITEPAADDEIIAGTGEAGATVFVTNTDTGVTKNGVVAGDASWSIAGWTALVEGETITAYQVDKAGNKSAVATDDVVA